MSAAPRPKSRVRPWPRRCWRYGPDGQWKRATAPWAGRDPLAWLRFSSCEGGPAFVFSSPHGQLAAYRIEPEMLGADLVCVAGYEQPRGDWLFLVDCCAMHLLTADAPGLLRNPPPIAFSQAINKR